MQAVWGIPLTALLVTLFNEACNHKVFTTGFASFGKFLTSAPLALLVNALLVLVTLAPAFFLRRRVFWCVLVSAVWLTGGAVNGFILTNRMTPFTIADLTVLNTGLDTLPNYLSKKYIFLLTFAAAALLALLVFLIWKGPRNSYSGRSRCAQGAAAMGLTAALLAGCWSLAFHTGELSRVFSNLAFAYEDYGFAYCYLQTWLNTGIRRPAGYSEADMNRLADMVEQDTPAKTDAKTDVNVVYVQLESFIDPNEVKGLNMSENPVPYWTELKENYTSGYLTVPVVGAGTANTECEVLTGMSTRLFGPGEYPYKTCLLDHTVESVAYDLAENGYGTHAIHNHRATFYSRNQVYANLGFDDFTSLEYMPAVQKTPKNWAKDSVLTGQILKALNATPDQPDLVYTVSVQGHGKYPTTQVIQDPAVTVEDCPESVNRWAMEYYVNQVHEMDQFVRNLTAALSRRKEKTVLVLYGDHLPALGLTRSDMASSSLYRTEYIIWDNFGLPQEDKNLYAYQLSASVLGKLGITTGLVNSFHQFCREEPTYNLDLKKIQYDELYGQEYLQKRFGESYAPTDMKMGCAPISIESVTEVNGVWYVHGENFSPYCRVTVDGNLLETEYLSPWLLRLKKDPECTADQMVISVVDTHQEILSDSE